MDNLHLIQLNQYERPSITEERNRDWVGIGDNNDYYQSLIDAYIDSTTNQAVINGIVNQIYGKGLDATDSNEKPEQYAQMKEILNPHCLRKVCNDLKLLGEASLQISYKGNKIGKISHFPRETLRAEKMNEQGDVKNYYYAPDWTKVTRNTKLTKFPVFGSGAKNEIYIIKRFVTGFYYYSPADYQISYACLEKEIADFLINDAQNSFSGTKVINFNGGIPDRSKQLEIKEQIMSKLTGSYGEKVIVAFNNNAEQKCTIDDIPLADAPAHYQYLSEECQRKIMVTHRVSSPLLIGLRDSNNGLGNNADEIKNASLLFDNVVIKPYQELIIDCLDEIFAVNNIALNLYFKTLQPLEFTEIDKTLQDAEAIEEETGIKQDEEQAELELMANNTTPTLTDEISNYFIDTLKGEEVDEEWEEVDEREYSEDNESIEDWANRYIIEKDKTNLFVDSNSDGFSYLDKSFYKVRYRYAIGSKKKLKEYKNKKGKVTRRNKTRAFCEHMMNNKSIVYRIEDIDKASRDGINSDFGHNSQPYDLFKYKGGPYCRHVWKEVLYRLKANTEPSQDLIDYRKTREIPSSYQPTPAGRKLAIKPPINMPNQGHHPNWTGGTKSKTKRRKRR